MFPLSSRHSHKISRAAQPSALALLLLNLLLPCYLCLVPGSGFAQTKSPSPSFTVLSQRAAEARDAGRLKGAIVLYTKALALRPRWTEGWWALGTIEYDQDHYAKAARDFEKLTALDEKNGTAHAMLGLCQFELGKDDAALKNLLAAENLGVIKDKQLRVVALYHMGVLELHAGKYGGARESFEHLARDGVRSRELTLGLGLAALLIKQKESPAQATFDRSIVERAGEAEVLLAANDFDHAKQKYAELTKEFPDYPNLHFAFGRTLLEMHDTDQAVREFQLELNRDPENVNSMLEIAEADELVDPKEGLKYAEQAAKLAPRLPFAHYILGMLRLATGDATAAIPELEIAQKAFPQEAAVYFSLGKAYARAGRKEDASKARTEFSRLHALAEKPAGPTIYGSQTQPLDTEKP